MVTMITCMKHLINSVSHLHVQQLEDESDLIFKPLSELRLNFADPTTGPKVLSNTKEQWLYYNFSSYPEIEEECHFSKNSLLRYLSCQSSKKLLGDLNHIKLIEFQQYYHKNIAGQIITLWVYHNMMKGQKVSCRRKKWYHEVVITYWNKTKQ